MDKPHSDRNERAADKVAVIVIHGMGEQKPMETLRGFVRTVWERDQRLFLGITPPPNRRNSDTWSKPDRLSGSAELRRITTGRARDPQRPGEKGIRADFFELHWADLTADSTWGDFLLWLRGLLLRNPFACAVPKRLWLVWTLLWLLVTAISISVLSPAVVKSDLLKGTALQGFLSWQVWTVVTLGLVAVGAIAKTFLTSYFGDVARYVSAAPRNIGIRKAARERGLKLLSEINASNEYSRIIIVGHSLGSILAHDLVYLAWSDLAPRLDIPDGSELKLAVEDCEVAADALLSAAGYKKVDYSEDLRYDRGCHCLASPRPTSQDLPALLRRFRETQRSLFRKLSKQTVADSNGVERPAWLISDVVTLGSPLTYADFLLAKNRCELMAKSWSREILRSPPVLEIDEQGEPRYLHAKPGTTGVWQMHHAAALCATRWTNIHDESSPIAFPFGDVVSGPIARDFGPGVVDVKVRIIRQIGPLAAILPRLFTHTLYWTYKAAGQTPAPVHIRTLRDAINLLDEDEVEASLLRRCSSSYCERMRAPGT